MILLWCRKLGAAQRASAPVSVFNGSLQLVCRVRSDVLGLTPYDRSGTLSLGLDCRLCGEKSVPDSGTRRFLKGARACVKKKYTVVCKRAVSRLWRQVTLEPRANDPATVVTLDALLLLFVVVLFLFLFVRGTVYFLLA